jgi:putative transposase
MSMTAEPGAANGGKPAGPVADDGRVDAADEELARQLAERARAEGLSLTGPGGLLGRLTKVVLESALEGEMDAHLGYRKHDPAGDGSGNSRNGKRAKTVVTDVGPVRIEVPRDRDASFEPKIVAKRARRLGGVDDMVISLVAKGLTTGEVQAHLGEIYGVQVSRETISTITDRVLDGLAGWQSRPLDPAWFLPMVANPDRRGFACRDTRPTRCRLMLSAATSS